ncbi:MAG TPA: hypothetical protein DDZ81_16450 [Acetobacteraceae bacterium]|jgi:hypothetical protein|nr:hypothetical protein [Acetobacteraceae bacterium]
MRSEDESPGPVSLVGPPITVAVCVLMLYMLPHAVMVVLTVWTLGSFPIGVLIGHCVLSEE